MNTLAIARVCSCKLADGPCCQDHIISWCNQFLHQRQISITAAAHKAIVGVAIAVLRPSKLFVRLANAKRPCPVDWRFRSPGCACTANDQVTPTPLNNARRVGRYFLLAPSTQDADHRLLPLMRRDCTLCRILMMWSGCRRGAPRRLAQRSSEPAGLTGHGSIRRQRI